MAVVKDNRALRRFLAWLSEDDVEVMVWQTDEEVPILVSGDDRSCDLVHDLVRWAALLGGVVKAGTGVVARTVRTQLLGVTARLVNLSGAPTVRIPEQWPWAGAFGGVLARLRAIPAVPD